MTRTSGPPFLQRSSETRQLCAPRSTATRALAELTMHSPYSSLELRCPLLVGGQLSQKCLGQTAVHGDQMAGGAARLRSGQEEYCRRAIPRVDRLMGEGALRVEFRQPAA